MSFTSSQLLQKGLPARSSLGPQGLHLALAAYFLSDLDPTRLPSLSLSFPIWKGVIPGVTALQSSCEFCDIRAHECERL